jgi:hypothetical protein
MSLETTTEIDELKGRAGREAKVADAEDISGGVEAAISNVASFTLYLDVAGSVDLTLELSPDGGETWYEPRDESPISFGGDDSDLYRIVYDADRIRLTGSDGTAVTAQIREVV